MHDIGMTLVVPIQLESETIGIVLARYISWHHVQLPHGVLPAARSVQPMNIRLRAVMEGLLEERLLDEPTKLHFAVQPPPYPTEGVWVAVFDLEALKQALQKLSEQEIEIHRLVPECWPVEERHDNTLWLAVSGDAPYALWADEHGVCRWPLQIHVTHLNAYPEQVQAALSRASSVFAEPALADWAERTLNIAFKVQPQQNRLRSIATDSPWNLAQGSLSRHKPLSLRTKQLLAHLTTAPAWRPARWMATLLLLIQVGGINAAAWQADIQEKAIQDEINGTLQRAFPQNTFVVDAPAQMQRSLEALRKSSGVPTPHDMDVMLQLLQRHMPPSKSDISITNIVFDTKSLSVEGLQLDPQEAAVLESALRSYQLKLRQEGTLWTLNAEETP